VKRIANILLIGAVVGLMLPFISSYLIGESAGIFRDVPWMTVSALLGAVGLVLHVLLVYQTQQKLSWRTLLFLTAIAGLLMGVYFSSSHEILSRNIFGGALFILFIWIFLPKKQEKS
jgi:cytochrome bd-type quinol oxidase subunit 2